MLRLIGLSAALLLLGVLLARAPQAAGFGFVLMGLLGGTWLKEFRRTRAPSRYGLRRDMAMRPHTQPFGLQCVVLGTSPYRVLHASRGGFGAVYFVTRSDGVGLVLKSLRPEFASSEDLRKAFVRETRVLLDLPEHFAVVRALRTEAVEGQYFVTMPWIGYPDMNCNLRNRMRCRGRQTGQEAIDVAMSCAMALGATNERIPGLVHRDIKPENILLDGQQAMLTDFGLAKIGDEARGALAFQQPWSPLSSFSTIDGNTVAGTLPYMAPEQLTGGSVTERTDVYALGAVLYEMLTGRLLFGGTTPNQWVQAILNNNPVVPSRWLNGEHTVWDIIIMACLEKDPSNRPTLLQLWYGLNELYEILTGRRLFSQPDNVSNAFGIQPEWFTMGRRRTT